MIDLSPPEHQYSEAVEHAAMWLADQNPPPHPTVPALKERFGLTALEACEASALSVKYRTNRKAFG